MKSFLVIFSLFLTAYIISGCSKKGDAIAEPNLANVKFTTYTIDTLQLKVFVNGQLITDTLRTPQSVFSTLIQFYDAQATLKVENAVSGQVYVDSFFTLTPGLLTLSFVQFQSGQNLFVPPIPNEPAPAPGNYKVRFQYVQPADASIPFLDSIKCILRLSSVPVDTFVLRQFENSPFFEATLGSNYSMRILDPVTSNVIDNTTNNLNSNNGFTLFNTAVVFATSATNYSLQRIY